MTRAVALLRAINITGRWVKKDILRELFVGFGLTGVSTYITSGNVLFDAAAGDPAALESRLEAHLRAALGYEVTTFVRSGAKLVAVAAHEPFATAELEQAFALMVAFLKAPPDEASRARLLAYRRPSDDFALHGREVYWLRRTQISETNFGGAKLERALGMPATVRSITTVRKLAALAGGKEWIIRPVEPADKAEWLRMRLELWPDAPDKEAEEIERFMAGYPLPTLMAAFVCVRPEGGLCGLAEVAIHESAPGCHTDRIGFLEAWYVDPDQRGRGVGRALIERAEAWARAAGCREMASDTDPTYPLSPAAHAALGYEEVARFFRKDL